MFRKLLVVAVTLTAMALPAAASASALKVGIGGISATQLADPRFLALGIHEGRIGVAWNVAIARNNKTAIAGIKEWLAAASAERVTPLISFTGVNHTSPSIAQYTRAVRAFLKKFPTVKRYTPWNEPDWTPRPLSRHPKLAAGYFNALHKLCKRCTILAGDVYLPAAQLKPWLTKYVKAMRYKPSGWALHNYYDVRDHDAAQLKVLMKLTHGPIWLDETGGVENRGHWRRKSPQRAAADERFLFSLPRKYHRITRIYHYQWQLALKNGWDSALIGINGGIRPAYYVVKSAAAGKLPR